MNAIVPPGAPVAVVAPSGIHQPDRFRQGLEIARAHGIEVRPVDGLLKPYRYLAGDDDHRASQLIAALRDPRWAAVVARDSEADGSFVYAVRTTGVYCRPSCAARPAKPENVTFYRTAAQAERAYTTLVELQPNEADGHRRLAQLRERQRRFPQAVVQWQQVVRIRTDEPAGWLALASAQIKAGEREAARKTLQHVLDTGWESRFGNVKGRATDMLRRIGVMRPPR